MGSKVWVLTVNRKFHYVFSTNEFLPFICSPLKQFTTIYPLIFCHTFFPLMPFMHFSLRFSIYAKYTKGVLAFFSTFFRWRVLHCSQFCIYPRFFPVCYIHWNHSRILPFVFIGMFFTLSHSCLFLKISLKDVFYTEGAHAFYPMCFNRRNLH